MRSSIRVSRRLLAADAAISGFTLSLVFQLSSVLLALAQTGHGEPAASWGVPSLVLVVIPVGLVLAVTIFVASALSFDWTSRRSRAHVEAWLASASAVAAAVVLAGPRVLLGQPAEALLALVLSVLFWLAQYGFLVCRRVRST
jgi:MFS family permease